MDSEFDPTGGREPDYRPVLRRRDGTIRDDGYTSAPRPVIYEPARREVVARPVPTDDYFFDRHPPRQVPMVPAQRNPNRAGAIRNNARSIWHQLTRVAPWYLGAALAAWLIGRYLTHSVVWAFVTAAPPVLVWVWWMWFVVGQARAHYRGDALPPPGSHRYF